jgi:hypothetical protein
MPRSPNRSPIPLLTGVAVVLCATLFCLRLQPHALRGDEGTYVAMAASLARDFDLRFAESDRAWAEEHRGGPVALILQRTGHGVSYSKPVLYPMLAAPFVALLGEWGPAIANLAALLAALALARAYLERLGGRGPARDTLLTFAATGIVLPYVGWRMTESLQVALALAGLVLALGRRPDAPEATPSEPLRRGWADRLLASSRADLLGGVLLGLLISLREPNAVVAAVPLLAAAMARDLRRVLRTGGALVLGYLAALGLTWALTGSVNPYKSTRATFNATTGYPAGVESAAAASRFDSDDELATSSLALAPVFDGGRTAYATLYFLVGRHTGLLVFLPAAVFLAAAALRRPGRSAVAAVAGFAALALFYLVWLPANYFGGETFLGNRYILSAYPCLLVALGGLPARRTLLGAWAVAAVVGASALVSQVRFGELDSTSQSHAHAGLFRWLPYESTASNLDGRRDRYWAGDFVRFVDPFAAPEAWSFELRSDRPAAEAEIATHAPAASAQPFHLLVIADSERATFVVSDWRGKRRYPLASAVPGRAGGRIVHLPAPAWRRHRFWWSQESYSVRLLRFAIESPDQVPVTARVRYLGRNPPQEEGFARQVAPIVLPAEVPAGSRTTLPLRVTNTGAWTWSPESVTPVQIGVRLAPLAPDGADGGPAREPRFPLPEPVAAGETLEAEVTIDWPETPGRYRVSVDLVLEDLAWFADEVGEPLAAGVVEVTSR